MGHPPLALLQARFKPTLAIKPLERTPNSRSALISQISLTIQLLKVQMVTAHNIKWTKKMQPQVAILSITRITASILR
jgi:hypothetical protein